MPALKVQLFDGIAPRSAPTTLGSNQAQVAKNVKLYAGELRHWRGPDPTGAVIRASTQSIYRLHGSGVYEGQTLWMSWAGDVDVAPAPLQGSSQTRLFYTGDGAPKKTSFGPNTVVGDPPGAPPYPNWSQPLGIPAPTTAPTVSVSGTPSTGATTESRVYVITRVNLSDGVEEETAPSPASSIVSAQTGQTATVTFSAAGTAGPYNYIATRIYRSIAGQTTDSYQFVGEVTAIGTSFADNKSASQLGDALTTIGWLPPPDDLTGLVSLPFGSLAGFVDNTIYFSEPYYAHAWPIAYAVTLPYKVVGLGVFANTLVACTDRHPYLLSGQAPDAMSVERVPLLEPCVSKRSVASDETGVTYASPNGLVTLGPAVRALVTQELFRRDEWQALGPENIIGAVYDGRYLAFFPGSQEALVLSRTGDPALCTLDQTAVAAFVDSKTGSLFVVDESNALVQVDADADNPLTYTWKSKRFVLPTATSFSAVRVDANYTQDIGGTTEQTLGLKLYVEGAEAADMTISSWDHRRLPPVKGRTVEIELSGTLDVRSVTMATTAAELRVE